MAAQYRKVLVPTKKKHSIELPEYLFGKKVEVVASEIGLPNGSETELPKDLKNKKFWEEIDFNPNFPSLEEIRSASWPRRT
jgi:hypothetical protein